MLQLLLLMEVIRADQESDRHVAALWSELHGVGHEVSNDLLLSKSIDKQHQSR